MKSIAIIGAFIAVLAGGIIYWGMSEDSGTVAALDPSKITYFYGAECPHCQKVNAFLEENKIADKVTFEKLEVWHNRGNARLMGEAAKACGLDESKVGVPFVYAEGKCLIGEPDTIDFFKQKAGL